MKLMQVLFLGSALLFSGCGKDDKKTKSSPPPSQQPTTQTATPPKNAEEYRKLNTDFNKFIEKKEYYTAGEIDASWSVDVVAMRQAGYSENTIKEVQELYAEVKYNQEIRITYGDEPGTYGKVKVVVKAVKWVKKNWDNVLNRMPPKVKKIVVYWINLEVFFGLLDTYVNYSDKIEDVLTNALNDILPWWMEWSTPAIVFVITFAIPVL